LFVTWGALTYFPLLRAVQLNQASLLVSACLGTGAWLSLRGRVTAAGAICAVAAAFKPQFALILPLVACHSRRMAISGLGALAVLGLASLAYGGVGNHIHSLKVVLPQLAGGYAFYPNQAWSATFLRLAGVPAFDFVLPPSVPWARITGTVCAAATLLAGSWVLLVSGRRSDVRGQAPLALLFAWLVTTLASPISWEHHYVPALFIFAWLFREAWAGRVSRVTVALAAAAAPGIACYFEVRHWPHHPVAILAMSYRLWATLALALGVALHLLRRPGARNPIGSDSRPDLYPPR
jgi:hypothetical protein